MKPRICPNCATHLIQDVQVCPICQTGITDTPADDEEESASEGLADSYLLGSSRHKPARAIQTTHQRAGFNCGVFLGVMLGFFVFLVGVLSLDVYMALAGIICGAASAFALGIFFGACAMVLEFALNPVANRLNPERQAFFQKLEEQEDTDYPSENDCPPDDTPDLGPLPLPETNSTDITPDKDPPP